MQAIKEFTPNGLELFCAAASSVGTDRIGWVGIRDIQAIVVKWCCLCCFCDTNTHTHTHTRTRTHTHTHTHTYGRIHRFYRTAKDKGIRYSRRQVKINTTSDIWATVKALVALRRHMLRNQSHKQHPPNTHPHSHTHTHTHTRINTLVTHSAAAPHTSSMLVAFRERTI